MLALLLQPLQVPDVMTRFDAQLARSRTLAVAMDVKLYAPAVSGSATLRIGASPRLAYQLQLGARKYTYVSNPTGALEAESSQRIFREFPPSNRWPSAPASLPNLPPVLFPNFLVVRAVRTLAPQDAVWKPVAGAARTYEARFDTDMGPAMWRVAYDTNGRPATASQFRGQTDTPMLQYRFKSWTFDGAIPESTFSVIPPKGFTSFALEPEYWPLGKGDTFPMSGWSERGRIVDLKRLAGNRPLLVAIIAPDSPPSAGLLRFLDRKSASIGLDRAMRVAISIEGRPAVASHWRLLADATSRGANRLRVTSTPWLYLIGPDGKVAGLWKGYHNSMEPMLEREIAEAMRSLR